MAGLKLSAKGLDALRVKAMTQGGQLPVWKAALEEIGQLMLGILQERAPVGKTGRTKALLTARLDAREIPRFVAAGYAPGAMPTAKWKKAPPKPAAEPPKSGRFSLRKQKPKPADDEPKDIDARYPGILEGSQKIAFRYRSGPLRGQRTLNWIRGARPLIQRRVRTILARAAADVQTNWDKPAAGASAGGD